MYSSVSKDVRKKKKKKKVHLKHKLISSKLIERALVDSEEVFKEYVGNTRQVFKEALIILLIVWVSAS